MVIAVAKKTKQKNKKKKNNRQTELCNASCEIQV